eukprot:scaffold1433_cov178-Pinguiococcus_pyrenoidosus.AAC.2
MIALSSPVVVYHGPWKDKLLVQSANKRVILNSRRRSQPCFFKRCYKARVSLRAYKSSQPRVTLGGASSFWTSETAVADEA